MSKNKKTMGKVLELAKVRKIIRVRDLTEKGIHPEYLRRLCEKGLLMATSFTFSDKLLSNLCGLNNVTRRRF
jgi:hypothetical protein